MINKDQFLQAIRGKQIADAVLSQNGDQVQIETIITTDGYHIDVTDGKISHPAYEKELAEFQGKLKNALPGRFFEMRAQELSVDEMRKYAAEHQKTINANGSGVTQIFNGSYKVSFGEDLSKLRRS